MNAVTKSRLDANAGSDNLVERGLDRFYRNVTCIILQLPIGQNGGICYPKKADESREALAKEEFSNLPITLPTEIYL